MSCIPKFRKLGAKINLSHYFYRELYPKGDSSAFPVSREIDQSSTLVGTQEKPRNPLLGKAPCKNFHKYTVNHLISRIYLVDEPSLEELLSEQ